jgi:[CysO sulfur-carrier protein]-S-L-cysteine hydrolase
VSEPLYLTADAMRQAIVFCQSQKPLEACGFIIGADGLGTEVVPMANVHPDPVGHYKMDDDEILRFYSTLDREKPGLDVVATFHSHPTTVARMSNDDISAARDLSLPYMIVSLRAAQPSARAWRINLRAIGVKEVEEARLIFSEASAAVEEPEAPYALFPGNYVKIFYRGVRKSEDELSSTTARITETTAAQVSLTPDARQRNKPTMLLMERIRRVEIIREAPGAGALRREMIGHVKHMAIVLASDGDLGMAPDLTQALAVAFPPAIGLSIRKED